MMTPGGKGLLEKGMISRGGACDAAGSHIGALRKRARFNSRERDNIGQKGLFEDEELYGKTDMGDNRATRTCTPRRGQRSALGVHRSALSIGVGGIRNFHSAT